MSDEKRMIENYEVCHSIYLGDRETVFGVDKSAEYPYLLCDCQNQDMGGFGVSRCENVIAGDDYLEMMTLFTERINERIAQVLKERKRDGCDEKPLTLAHCLPTGMEKSLEGQVLVIKSDSLRPEYATANHQLVLATGGNGCTPDARGRAVFCTALRDGERSRWERCDVLGVADLSKLPQWARDAAHILKAPVRHKEDMER